MRVVIQRVTSASVRTEIGIIAKINTGLMVLVGIEDSDKNDDIEWLCNKIIQLRIFNDKNGTMNFSVVEVGGEILAVSQFTLHARTKKGNRPSYIKAAHPDIAIPIYNQFISRLSQLLGKEVASGKFGAKMMVEIINDGPVTLIIDTKNKE
jgi:D-aminoacyl-tRNA deacylase